MIYWKKQTNKQKTNKQTNKTKQNKQNKTRIRIRTNC